MTTSSMTKATSHSASDQNRHVAIKKMQANLVRYARANDRRMVLRSLRDVKYLNSILLDPAQSADGPTVFDLEKEVASEKLVLNGIPFKAGIEDPDGRFHDSLSVRMKSSCIPMIKGLCTALCNNPGVKMSTREIYEKLIVRLAKTTASADPYFRLNSLLGSADLIVMPLNDVKTGSSSNGSHGRPNTIHRSKSDEELEPIQLNLYETEGAIHIKLKESYEFGLFRKSDVSSGRPWIVLQAIVNERANLQTSASVRTLRVKFPDLY